MRRRRRVTLSLVGFGREEKVVAIAVRRRYGRRRFVAVDFFLIRVTLQTRGHFVVTRKECVGHARLAHLLIKLMSIVPTFLGGRWRLRIFVVQIQNHLKRVGILFVGVQAVQVVFGKTKLLLLAIRCYKIGMSEGGVKL